MTARTPRAARPAFAAAVAGPLAVTLALIPAADVHAASIISAPTSIAAGGDVVIEGECTGTIADRVLFTLWRFDAANDVQQFQGDDVDLDDESEFTIVIDSDAVGTPNPGDWLRVSSECWVTVDTQPASVFTFDALDITIDGTVPVDPDPVPGTPPQNPGVRFRTGIEDALPGAAVLVGLGVLLLGTAAAGVRRQRRALPTPAKSVHS